MCALYHASTMTLSIISKKLLNIHNIKVHCNKKNLLFIYLFIQDRISTSLIMVLKSRPASLIGSTENRPSIQFGYGQKPKIA